MYKLEYLPVARKDMLEIVRYIRGELQNPDAADRLAVELVDAAENGGFAGTAGSQNCDLFPFVDVEADFFKYFQISEAFTDIFYS